MMRLAAPAFSFFLALNAWGADVAVSGAWIRLLPAGAPAGGYFVLHNNGNAPVALTGAASPAFGRVMLHRTVEKDGVSRMMHVDRIEVPPGGTVAFSPGGYHLMLMQPRREMHAGAAIPITLQLAGGMAVTAEFEARGLAGR